MADESTKPTNDDIGALFMGESAEEPVADEVELEPVLDEEVSEDEVSEEPTAEVEPDDIEELVEVEWNGQVIEAPKEVAEALMRQSDYTQKTQEVAEQRKTYEIALEHTRQAQETYQFAQAAQSVAMEIQQADQMIAQWEQHLSTNAREMDAAQIAQAQLEIKNIERFKADKQQELQGKQTEFQQSQEQALRELLDKGTEVLRSRIPGWGESHVSAVKEYGLANGFTEQELGNVIDPRQVETLWKASQYDLLQAGKTAAVKKAQAAPTIKSKARNPMPKDVQDKLNLRKKLKSKNLTTAEKQAAFADDIGKRWG